MLGGIYGWVMEPADDDENPPHHHDPAEALDDGEAPAAELAAGRPSRPTTRAAETEEAAGG